MKTNVQTQSDVRAELAWDPAVRDGDIRVAAIDGVVTLTGTVPTYADRTAAQRAAERVFGVRAVANELAVALPIVFERTDTDIARAVVDALTWDVQVPDARIKSAVSSGWVTLDGNVDWGFERDAAVRAVRNITGVRGVTNNLIVTAKPVSTFDVSRGIKQALERHADRTASHITVEARDGIVTLSGNVASYGERRAAEGAAWAAPGVKEVKDHLAVTW